MSAFDDIAESRIRDAIGRGELDGLPGAGRPLELEDERLVPEELRVAYRILRNAGFVPPEIELRRDIASVEQLLLAATGPEARGTALRRLELLRLRLDASRRGLGHLALERDYYEKLADRLAHATDR